METKEREKRELTCVDRGRRGLPRAVFYVVVGVGEVESASLQAAEHLRTHRHTGTYDCLALALAGGQDRFKAGAGAAGGAGHSVPAHKNYGLELQVVES